MKIKVLRDYSGAEGSDVDRNVRAEQEFTVTRARGNELAANGLVEIIEDEEDDVSDEPEVKQADKPANKQAATPKNKAAPKSRAKAKSA